VYWDSISGQGFGSAPSFIWKRVLSCSADSDILPEVQSMIVFWEIVYYNKLKSGRPFTKKG
jgi:hypothetical protein